MTFPLSLLNALPAGAGLTWLFMACPATAEDKKITYLTYLGTVEKYVSALNYDPAGAEQDVAVTDCFSNKAIRANRSKLRIEPSMTECPGSTSRKVKPVRPFPIAASIDWNVIAITGETITAESVTADPSGNKKTIELPVDYFSNSLNLKVGSKFVLYQAPETAEVSDGDVWLNLKDFEKSVAIDPATALIKKNFKLQGPLALDPRPQG